MITGAPGVGKTAIVRYWLSKRRISNKPFWLNGNTYDRVLLDAFVNQIRDVRHGDSITVIIDGSDYWTEEQYDEATRNIFNYKAVSTLIFTTRNKVNLKQEETLNLSPMSESQSFDLVRKLLPEMLQKNSLFEGILLSQGYPLGISILSELLRSEKSSSILSVINKPLYELSNNILIPPKDIIVAAPPIIISVKENLITR